LAKSLYKEWIKNPLFFKKGNKPYMCIYKNPANETSGLLVSGRVFGGAYFLPTL
jgi:hypothetical protein